MPLPTPGGSKDKWGKMLNFFLRKSHTEDGDLLPEVIAEIRQGLADGADVTALQDQVDVSLNADGTPITGEIGDAYILPKTEWDSEVEKVDALLPDTVPTMPGKYPVYTGEFNTGKAEWDGPFDANWNSDLNVLIDRARSGARGVVEIVVPKDNDLDYTGMDEILLYSYMKIRGASRNVSRIRNDSPGATVMRAAPAPGGGQVPTCEFLTFEDFRIYSPDTAEVGLDMRGIRRSTLRNIQVHGFADVQIWAGGDEVDYHSAWSNVFHSVRMTTMAGSSGLRMDGETPGGVAMANRFSFYELYCNGLSAADTIAVELIAGDQNNFYGGDIGYGELGLAFWVGLNANNNRWYGGTSEAILRGVEMHGLRNIFRDWIWPPTATIINKTGARYNEYYSTQNGVITNDDGDDNRTISEGNGVKESTGLTLRAGTTGSQPFKWGVRGDANSRGQLLGNGAVQLLDPVTGLAIAGLEPSGSAGQKFRDTSYTQFSLHASLATANSSRRGSPARMAGASGASDSLHIAEKNDADTYLWRQASDLLVNSKTANFTAGTASCIYLCNATAGAITVTLPAVATSATRRYIIKKTDAVNNVVVDGAGSETIDGATTKTITTQHGFIEIACSGSAWFIVAQGGTIT